jgi:hypothetical protein
VVIARERLDPLVVLGSALVQDLFGDDADDMHVAKEMHNVLGTRE